jgi:hypothetical protein
LYHIGDDPLERNNLAGEQPRIVDQLMKELEYWFESVEGDRRKIDDQLMV